MLVLVCACAGLPLQGCLRSAAFAGLCAANACAGLAVHGGRVKSETQTQTQSYEKLLQNVRSGIFDDPDNPDRNLLPFQMLFGRSVIAIVTMVFWQNINLKKAVWDGI